MENYKLYSYFRSSASYRVRIALNLKSVGYDIIPTHLLKNGGVQNSPAYREVNPSGTVPTLLTQNGDKITQSVAIIDYLDNTVSKNKLFPSDPNQRAHVLEFCELINSGIQPLQNLKVVQYLQNNLGIEKSKCDDWVRHWIIDGMNAVEKWLSKSAGTHCFADTLTAADCFLIPQLFAMKRFQVDSAQFPNAARIENVCNKMESFIKAHPQNQIDFEA